MLGFIILVLFNTIPEKAAAGLPVYAWLIDKKKKIKKTIQQPSFSYDYAYISSKENIRNWQCIKNKFTVTNKFS